MNCKDCCQDCQEIGCDIEVNCTGYVKKPKTNADRIRSMTDEELADWLATITNPNTAVAYNGYCLSGSTSMFLEWLQAESGEA